MSLNKVKVKDVKGQGIKRKKKVGEQLVPSMEIFKLSTNEAESSLFPCFICQETVSKIEIKKEKEDGITGGAGTGSGGKHSLQSLCRSLNSPFEENVKEKEELGQNLKSPGDFMATLCHQCEELFNFKLPGLLKLMALIRAELNCNLETVIGKLEEHKVGLPHNMTAGDSEQYHHGARTWLMEKLKTKITDLRFLTDGAKPEVEFAQQFRAVEELKQLIIKKCKLLKIPL